MEIYRNLYKKAQWGIKWEAKIFKAFQSYTLKYFTSFVKGKKVQI